MSECEQTRRFCRALEAQGAMTLPLVGNRYAPPSWPDRFIAHLDWRGFIEFKEDNGKLRPDQREVIKRLLAHKMPVWVARFGDNNTIRLEDEDGQAYTAWMRWSKALPAMILLSSGVRPEFSSIGTKRYELTQLTVSISAMKGNRRVRQAVFECNCGETVIGAMHKVCIGGLKKCAKCRVGSRAGENNPAWCGGYTVNHKLTYVSYRKMLRRCGYIGNTEDLSYLDISVCDRWLTALGFENFLADIGERPSINHSLDRIDATKGYCKDNCRWVTKSENSSGSKRKRF